MAGLLAKQETLISSGHLVSLLLFSGSSLSTVVLFVDATVLVLIMSFSYFKQRFYTPIRILQIRRPWEWVSLKLTVICSTSCPDKMRKSTHHEDKMVSWYKINDQEYYYHNLINFADKLSYLKYYLVTWWIKLNLCFRREDHRLPIQPSLDRFVLFV